MSDLESNLPEEPKTAETEVDNRQEAPESTAKRISVKKPKSWVTFTLIALSVAVYLAQLMTPRSNGLNLPLIYLGKVNELILMGQLWRLITPIFVHGSIIHLAFNMYALYIIGNRLEVVYGHGRFCLLYFLGAFGGNVLSFVMSRNISVGASTAIFSLLAAEIALIVQNRQFFGDQMRPVLINLGMILVVNLSIGLVPGSRIDLWGHVGGVIAGFVYAMLAGPKWKLKRVENGVGLADTREKKELWLAAIMVAAAFAVMAAIPFYKK
ncbi:MAG TPA: rhomboid family intramembrane serine protease [Anaerolineaceae bacterium]|nr:rhomboid family intramembrane serine protease [Chloroflexota bacterium]HNY84327.1 rhomboid family intramembrane serine protease [Anaerolineaceae bacterium]